MPSPADGPVHSSGEITELLVAWRAGNGDAHDRLFPLIYDGLREIARRQRRSAQPPDTLGTTALVNEAYLKLVDQTRVQWINRSHFFAVAATAMRRILVDHARRHRALKRGGATERFVSLDDASLRGEALSTDDRADVLLALDDGLTRLAQIDQRLSRVVECRFFGGLTEEETAAALDVTPRTVRRDWVKAKTWLHAALHD